ncbi:MAG: hypothetical protein ACFHVJ_17965 [Aestuariibacter sp.]
MAPVIEPLLQELLVLRESVDANLSGALPELRGKSYPLGRCREIRDAVYDALQSSLEKPVTPGLQALRNYAGQTGGIQKVWGDLRSQYFQNAMYVGDYYIDVANDTVDINKPKIEILPKETSGLRTITDYQHFAEVARNYWKTDIYSNHVFGFIAPVLPLILVYPEGDVQLAVANDHMIQLTRESAFQHSIDALLHFPPAPDEVAAELLQASRALTSDLLLPGINALATTTMYQQSQRHLDDHYRDKCVVTFLQLKQAGTVNL